MDTAPETPKAKRHYTVTDKVREARRASLAKAREKARQAPRGYERGDHEDDVAYKARLARQLKPWCANLRRAAAAKKADRSPAYAPHFIHGLTAPDLDRPLRTLRKRFEALWMARFDPGRWERLARHILEPASYPNEPMYLAGSPNLMDLLAAKLGASRDRRRAVPKGSRGHAKSGVGESEVRQSGVAQSGVARVGESGVPQESDGTPGPRAPRNPFNSHFDPLEYLCRTRSRGLQDWRLRLDELTADALGLPFQSPARVESALERQAAPAPVDEAGEGDEAVEVSDRRHRHPRIRRMPGIRARDRRARLPEDALLEDLARAGKLVDINSLAMLQELLAQCLHQGDAQKPEVRGGARQSVAALAEALWTRIAGLQVLVETLEELLVRMLEYHGGALCSGGVLTADDPMRCSGGVPTADKDGTGDATVSTPRPAVRTSPLPSEAPAFEAILKSRKAAIRESRAPGGGPEDSAPSLSLDDLRIHLDPFLPNESPLDGLRLWFEAADGVLRAGHRLAQRVDVALYEFAVRRFGIQREFVAWRPALGLDQWREREGRPEWAPRVTTVEGEVVVKLSDEEMKVMTR